MSEEELLKIRSYVDDPESTGEFKYGKWGILNTEQRRTIRRLIDYVISCEVVNKHLQQETQQLKEEIKGYQQMYFDKLMIINKAIEYINEFEDIKAYYSYEENGYEEYNYDEDFKIELLEILKGGSNE